MEHKYVEEFSTSNFIAISEDGAYVTSESSSILPSVTNRYKCVPTATKYTGTENSST